MVNYKTYLKCVLILFLFVSCSEIRTENKDKIFELWTGSTLPKNVTVINGSYWQSAHWSKEYEVYIQIKATNEWWNELKNINELSNFKSSFNEDIERKFFRNKYKAIIEQPQWFKPKKSSEIFIRGGSEYFWNPKNKMLFIHEIQL